MQAMTSPKCREEPPALNDASRLAIVTELPHNEVWVLAVSCRLDGEHDGLHRWWRGGDTWDERTIGLEW